MVNSCIFDIDLEHKTMVSLRSIIFLLESILQSCSETYNLLSLWLMKYIRSFRAAVMEPFFPVIHQFKKR